MVTMQTADNALKSYYLDAVSEIIDTEKVQQYAAVNAVKNPLSNKFLTD